MNGKRYWALFLGLLFVDRVTKYWAYHYFGNKLNIFSFLSCHLTFNRGIACGILNVTNETVFLSVSFFVIGIFCFFTFFTYQRWQSNTVIIPEICILAGGVSNIIDRFMYQGVVDFLIFSWNSWSWPAFNIADALIMCGVGFLGLSWLNE